MLPAFLLRHKWDMMQAGYDAICLHLNATVLRLPYKYGKPTLKGFKICASIVQNSKIVWTYLYGKLESKTTGASIPKLHI